MSTGGEADGSGGTEDSEVSGKSVRVSIMAQLQSFRRDKAQSSSSTPHYESSKKVQKVLTKPSQSPKMAATRTSSTDAELSLEHSVNPSVTVLELAEEEVGSSPTESAIPSISHEEEGVILDQDGDIGDGQVSLVEEESDESAKVSKEIRPIDRSVVHQICSGQVIVTLGTAVKELVENSLDAGATRIDIRLIEYGSKLIEVSDDASGIEESNFEGLALKHHTSKITEFEDLGSLLTFGFRGEALSSLCALSSLTVTTRHKQSDQKIGHRIEYDIHGRISSKTSCAREHGTTISLRDLFHTLPVRHKEFLKNLKREFHRMVNILYGYCLVVNSVRITCINQTGSGGPTKVLAVPAYHSMKERIVALFGSKQFTSLIEIKQPDEVPEEILSEFGLSPQSYDRKYELEGYISQPNQGRSSNDRQFYFINSRPCDPAKISRVINEIYHTFSRHQNPFVCLHIRTNLENVDVNVTPDKRTLYVQNEKILLATLKAALVPLLASAASSFSPLNSFSSQSQLNFSGQSQNDEDNTMNESSSYDIEHQKDPKEGQSSQESKGGFARQYSTAGRSSCRLSASAISKTNDLLKRFSRCSRQSSFKNDQDTGGNKRARDHEASSSRDTSKQPKLSGFMRKYDVTEKRKFGGRDQSGLYQEDSERMEEDDDEVTFCEPGHSDPNEREAKVGSDDDEEVVVYDDVDVCETEEASQNQNTSGNVSVSVNWKDVAKLASSLQTKDATSNVNYARRFRARIAPEDNSSAEEELKKQLSKDMFSQMEILGQFNLGFIIVRIGPDLFIVDQHASDEKYNFEDLEKTTVLQGQLLIRPLDLKLPAISENIIIENVKAFQRNGFDFIISPDEEPTKRVKLSKIPYSKNTQFDKSDLEELVFMMEDATKDSFYRPTKVREMLASRACRKSVMIGTALGSKEMRSIVNHMGEMEQPWNCPHGRPTIRHLINLNLLPDSDSIKFNH